MCLANRLTILAGIVGALAWVVPEVAADPCDSMVLAFFAASLVLGAIIAALLRVRRERVCTLDLPPGPLLSPQDAREAA